MQADIFCRVVDNYGDIGVCWRLARRLAHGRARRSLRIKSRPGGGKWCVHLFVHIIAIQGYLADGRKNCPIVKRDRPS
jgi:hypothetical protein